MNKESTQWKWMKIHSTPINVRWVAWRRSSREYIHCSNQYKCKKNKDKIYVCCQFYPRYIEIMFFDLACVGLFIVAIYFLTEFSLVRAFAVFVLTQKKFFWILNYFFYILSDEKKMFCKMKFWSVKLMELKSVECHRYMPEVRYNMKGQKNCMCVKWP